VACDTISLLVKEVTDFPVAIQQTNEQFINICEYETKLFIAWE
jgi:hypothetical protein